MNPVAISCENLNQILQFTLILKSYNLALYSIYDLHTTTGRRITQHVFEGQHEIDTLVFVPCIVNEALPHIEER